MPTSPIPAPVIKIATVFGEQIEVLENIEAFPRHEIAGHIMTDDGFLGRRVRLLVRVTPDGQAWSDTPGVFTPRGYAIAVERWGDGDRIGENLCPDGGELDRCGIVPVLCGSAARA